MAELTESTTEEVVDELISRGEGHIVCTAADDVPRVSADVDARRAADILTTARERIESDPTSIEE